MRRHASQTASSVELIAEGCHGVTRYQPTGDKTMRMHAQTAVIGNCAVESAWSSCLAFGKTVISWR